MIPLRKAKIPRTVAGMAKTIDEPSGDGFCLFNDCRFSSFPDEPSFEYEKK